MKAEDINYNVIIFMLMIATGSVLYFMYFKPTEGFTEPNTVGYNVPDTATSTAYTATSTAYTATPTTSENSPTTTSNSPTTSTIPFCMPLPTANLPSNNQSIISRYFGVGFNITYFKYNNTVDTYLINHIPITANGTIGGCYAITSDNLLTIRLQNNEDSSQLWTITKNTDTDKLYYSVQSVLNPNFALQYENGNIALRPYKSNSVFEGQKWLLSNDTISRGIPVLNYSPASLFTPEFDPYSSKSSSSSSNTMEQNSQINSVIKSVKEGIQQYLGQLNNKNQLSQVSSSSLGNVGNPFQATINLTSSNTSIPTSNSQRSSFEDVATPLITSNNSESDSFNDNDIAAIMDKYGPSSSSSMNRFNDTVLYKKNTLDNEIAQNQGCALLNMNDYISNRVGSCNCKL